MRNIARQIKLKTKLNFFKKNPSLTFITLMTTVFPLFMIMMFTIVFSNLGKDIPNVNYEEISKNGKYVFGEITNIKTVKNTTINNEHPSIISYKYEDNIGEKNSKVEVFEPEKVSTMNVGDEVAIVYLGEDSIIKGLEPFSFPKDIFLFLFLPFVIVGLVTFSLLIYRFNREMNLYQFGEVKEAKLVSMVPKSSLNSSFIGQIVIIHYQYENELGENILSKSTTSDFAILNEKKAGDSISIFVSPDNPSYSCLIPKLEAIRNNWKL